MLYIQYYFSFVLVCFNLILNVFCNKFCLRVSYCLYVLFLVYILLYKYILLFV